MAFIVPAYIVMAYSDGLYIIYTWPAWQWPGKGTELYGHNCFVVYGSVHMFMDTCVEVYIVTCVDLCVPVCA